MRWILRIAGVAIAIFIAAKLSQHLTVPPSNASPVWPGAGIALAVAIYYGPRALLGVFIGVFLFEFQLFAGDGGGQTTSNQLILSFGLGIGASAQAFIGAELIRRFLDDLPQLVRDKEILKFQMLGGPIACLVSASIGMTLLWSLGYIAITDLPISWLTWWVGDTLGASIFAPLVLILLNRKDPLWRKRSISVAIPTVLMLLMAIAFFSYADHWKKKEDAFEFKRLANQYNNSLERVFGTHIRTLELLGDFFRASEYVSKQEFSDFNRSTIRDFPGIQALEWIPRVTHAQRSEFEKSLPAGGGISRLDSTGILRSAEERPEYYAIQYIEPPNINNRAFGFDITSNPIAAKALYRAIESRQITATNPLTLVQGLEGGFVLYNPIFKSMPSKAVSENDQQELIGVVASVFHTKRLIELDLPEIKQDLVAIRIFDQDVNGDSQLVYQNQNWDLIEGNTLIERKLMVMGGQQWRLEYAATPDFYLSTTTWVVWTILFGGLLLTATLGANFFMLTGRTLIMEEQVLERTTELSDALRDLEKEKRFLQTLFDALPDLVWLKDINGCYVTCNHHFERLYGHPEEKIAGRDDFEFVDKETADNFRENDRLAVEKGGPRMNEEWLTFASNDYRGLFETIKTPMYDHDGQVIGVLGISRDISERQQREIALKESRNQLSSIYHASPMGIGLLVNRVFVEVNDTFCKLVGYTRDELIGKSSRLVYHTDTEHDRVGRIKYEQITKSGVGTVETVLRKKDGTSIDVSLSSAALDPDDISAGVTFTALDITARIEASKAIQRHAQEQAYLLRFGRELSATLELDELVQVVANRIIAFTQFDTSAVYLLNGHILHLSATLPPLPADFPDALLDARLRDHPHIRKAIESQQIINIEDTGQVELTPTEKAVVELRHLQSILFLPMSVGSEVFGVVIAGTTGDKQITTSELMELCGTYANMSALAIANVKQYATTRDALTNLSESEEKYRSLMEHSPLAIQEVSPEGKTIRVNHAWEQLWGIGFSALEKYNLFTDEQFADKGLQAAIDKAVRVGSAEIPAYEYIKAGVSAIPSQKDRLWLRTFLYPIQSSEGELREIVLIQDDVTEQKIQEKRILQQAHFDSLTNLPNRLLALDRLTQMINQALRNDKRVAVLFLDLDDFKKINDTLGHDTGDKLLKEAAARLQEAVRKEDTVGRLGGDEFIILQTGITDATDVHPIAKSLLNRFRENFSIDNRELMLTASIGVAVYPDDGDNPSELLRNADSAMYHSKAQGRNTYSFFTDEMNERLSHRLLLEEQMHGALNRGEFEVYYQAKVDLISREIVGVEALLRWFNPVLKQVSPDDFIPIAEQTGLIVSIGQFVLTEAVNMIAAWQRELGRDINIAVNLSPRQFRDLNLVSFIDRTLQQSGNSGDSLELEITEGVLMSGQSYVQDALDSLNQLGVTIAMDDFGTGYSSLSNLRNYPFDVIKIDREFIRDITTDPGDRELVIATIAMANGLGLKVVAEGVETIDQLNLLSSIGCHIGQGYYFNKPVTADEMTAILKSGIQS